MEHMRVEKHTGEIWKVFREKLLYAKWLYVPLSYKYFRTETRLKFIQESGKNHLM